MKSVESFSSYAVTKGNRDSFLYTELADQIETVYFLMVMKVKNV
jgi:hypothetical protein